MWKETRDREFGYLRPNSFVNRIARSRLSSIQLSNYKEIVSAHHGSVNSLQVDLTESRYLLAGAADATVAVYDVQRATNYEGGGLIAKHKSVFVINKQHENGHKYAVSSAIWYPIDTGLFVTGSYDHHVNVWDTNTTQVVQNYKMPGKVYKISMSPQARSHMLIAAGTEDVQVRLCDIASGAFAHTLSGHRDGVMSLEWSTSSEWVLVTGGRDGAIRFWDIRRAGCFHILDQYQSQLGRRPPLLPRASAIKKSSSAGQSSNAKVRAPQRKVPNGNALKPHSTGRMSNHANTTILRLHPGMLSSHDRATSHYGVVTGIKGTDEGMYLLSAGSDSRLKLWDIKSGCNTLVNYETKRLQSTKAVQMAVSHDSTLVFIPCMSTVKVFDMWSGRTKGTLCGHYESVNCCWYNAQDHELYTGSHDRQILVWSSSKSICDEMVGFLKLNVFPVFATLFWLEMQDGGWKGQKTADAVDQDNWSD